MPYVSWICMLTGQEDLTDSLNNIFVCFQSSYVSVTFAHVCILIDRQIAGRCSLSCQLSCLILTSSTPTATASVGGTRYAEILINHLSLTISTLPLELRCLQQNVFLLFWFNYFCLLWYDRGVWHIYGTSQSFLTWQMTKGKCSAEWF